MRIEIPVCGSTGIPGEEIKDLLLPAGDGGQGLHDGAGSLPGSLGGRSEQHLEQGQKRSGQTDGHRSTCASSQEGTTSGLLGDLVAAFSCSPNTWFCDNSCSAQHQSVKRMYGVGDLLVHTHRKQSFGAGLSEVQPIRQAEHHGNQRFRV